MQQLTQKPSNLLKYMDFTAEEGHESEALEAAQAFAKASGKRYRTFDSYDASSAKSVDDTEIVSLLTVWRAAVVILHEPYKYNEHFEELAFKAAESRHCQIYLSGEAKKLNEFLEVKGLKK